MLDTLKLESPVISELVAAHIEGSLTTRTAVDNRTGERLYLFNSGSLEGSWDSRIMVQVLRERLVRVASLEPSSSVEAVGNQGRYQMRSCAPFLRIEGSVHKAMLGHNVYGGPESFQESARWFLDHIASDLSVRLPEASSWLVRRADWAECYRMPYEAIADYIWAMNNARFPRRKSGRYGEESVTFAGRTTAVNIYHKGPEFHAHDHKRLRGAISKKELEGLQQVANGIMRAEVQIKARKLDDDFGHKPTVADVTEDYLKPVHDREMARLIREGKSEMKTVRKQKDVLQRLHQLHDQRLAGVLFGTWFQLSTLGEGITRQHISRRTFYRHRKQLQDAGVAWVGSDVLVLENVASFPQDFAPLRTDPRHVAGEDPAVVSKLAAYRAA
jgi:II/X family phage/plasmid replication protein